MAATDISQLGAKQLQRAKRVIEVASEYLDKDPDVVLGALTTANDESTFRLYANDGTYAGKEREAVWKWYGGQDKYKAHMRLSLNPKYGADAAAGGAETTKDSMNLTQFREMYGYAGMGNKPVDAAIDRMMDPDYAIKVFCAGVPGQPGAVRSWLAAPDYLHGHEDLTIAKRCQWVQGSEFPTGLNYLEAVHVARQLIARYPIAIPTPEPSGYIPRLLHWSK